MNTAIKIINSLEFREWTVNQQEDAFFDRLRGLPTLYLHTCRDGLERRILEALSWWYDDDVEEMASLWADAQWCDREALGRINMILDGSPILSNWNRLRRVVAEADAREVAELLNLRAA